MEHRGWPASGSVSLATTSFAQIMQTCVVKPIRERVMQNLCAGKSSEWGRLTEGRALAARFETLKRHARRVAVRPCYIALSKSTFAVGKSFTALARGAVNCRQSAYARRERERLDTRPPLHHLLLKA